MAIVVDTKDCTALSDAELGEMADICADGPARYDVGLLSKQCEEWVLVTQAHESNKLLGFSFCTLERIGGTPSVLIGLASVKRNGKRDAVLKALVGDQLRRAVLAFPDEDVLVGTRLLAALESRRVQSCGERQIRNLLGHAPDRLLVALTAPIQGYCYKAVMGVLPRR